MSPNYLAIVVAAIAVFVFAAAYYTLLAPRGAQLGAAWAQAGRPSPALMLAEFIKALVVSVVVAALVLLIGITDIVGAVELALSLWVAFPVVLLIGSVTQENVRPGIAVIHAGDWLAKLLIVALIPALWR